MATRYWVGGGSSQNWNATGNTNWGTASGVQDNASVPTSVDDVIFDGAGAGGNTDSTISATITVKSLTINSGYTATMTHNDVLTIAGNWTMSNTHTIAGTSDISITGGTTTITSGGQTWPNGLQLNGSTYTLASNLIISGKLTIANLAGVSTVNSTISETLSCNGINTSNQIIGGTAKIILTGGDWTSGTNQRISNNLDIQGNITVSGNVYYGTGTLKYVSGTITTTGSTLNITGCTLDTSGITWDNVGLQGGTYTLNSDFVCSGLTTVTNLGGVSTLNTSTSKTYSTFGINTSNQIIVGTAKIILTGGTWSSGAGQRISNNLDLQGDVTISSNVYYGTGTLKYVSGTITTTGSTLNITGCILDTNGVTWNNTGLQGGTYTLSSDYTCTGLTTVTNLGGGSIVNTSTSKIYSTSGINCSTGTVSGTAKIILTTGTWSSSANQTISNNLDIQGNITVSGNVYYLTGTLKYISGTITTTGSTLNITGSCTLDTNGITWNNVVLNYNGTTTLSSSFICTGTTSQAVFTNPIINKTTSETWSTNGVSLLGALSSRISGTAEILLTGGTWSSSGGEIRNNLTFTGNTSISGNVYYSIGILKYTSGTITTTGSTLNITGSCTLDVSGITWNNIVLNHSGTTTLNSNFVCTGTTTQAVFTTPIIDKTTSETWSTNGISLLGSSSSRISGSAEILLTGGAWSSSGAEIRNNLTFTANITISGNVYYGVGVLKYTSGTITTTGSTLNINGSCTLNTNGITWNNVILNHSGTNTLTSNFVCTGTTTQAILTTPVINKTASETWSTNGISLLGSSASRISGTAEVILTGGTWSSIGAEVRNNLTFTGNVTISGNVYYSVGILKYTSGTIITTGSTLNTTGSCTLDTNGINWNNVSLSSSSGQTYTINSLLNVLGTITFGVNASSTTFSGTSGWTCGTLTNASTSIVTINLKDGNTYTINTLLDCYQSRVGSIVLFTSSHASNRAFINLTPGANCRCLANFTRVDASGGRPIYTFNGTVTDCVNIKAFNDLTTIASSYVNL